VSRSHGFVSGAVDYPRIPPMLAVQNCRFRVAAGQSRSFRQGGLGYCPSCFERFMNSLFD
jgi:hypothetical protein